MKLDIRTDKKVNSYFFEVFFDNEYVGLAEAIEKNEKVHDILFELQILKFAEEINLTDLSHYILDSFRIPFDTERFYNLNWLESEKSCLWFEYQDSSCMFYLFPNYLNWNKPISLLTLIEQLKPALEARGMSTKFDSDLLEEGLGISTNFNKDEKLKVEYDRVVTILNDEANKIFEKFGKENSQNEFLSIFSFPSEIRQICEQYLIYFCKFLEDLGIEATAKLDAQTKSTFFTIIPKNSNDALSKIKDLLDLYLSLIENPNLESLTIHNSDVSVSQLISNIYHLKSQLILTNSIIEAKNATIESLKFTTYQQSILLDGASKKNEEKVLDGILTVTDFQGKGFKINLPEVFRRLKRVLKK